MEKGVLSLLNSKYAIILAFIPIINIAYLAFRLLFVRAKVGRVPIWYFAIIAVPAVVLYNILPDLWGWCVTHFVISCIAAFYMYKSRGCYKGNLGFKPNTFWIMLVIFVVVFSANAIYIVKPAYSMGWRQEKLYEAIDALIDNDEEAWLEYVHPEHGEKLSDIGAVRKRFSVKLAGLERGFEHLTNRGTSFFSYEAEDGEAAGVHVYVKSKGSGQRYLISAAWQDCEHGSGIVMLEIMLD